MAGDEQPKGNNPAPAADRPVERVEKPSTTVDSKTVSDLQQGTGANWKDNFAQLKANTVSLDGRLEAGKDGSPTITIQSPNPYKGLKGPDGVALTPPPDGGVTTADSGPKTNDGAKTPTDAQGLMKTDGKIDMPAKKPDNMTDAQFEDMRKQVEALNKNLADPKSGLTDQQKQDIERSAEQMLNNKNPDGTDRKPPIQDMTQVTKTLEQANRMFDKADVIRANGFSDQERNMMLTSMVHDVANPKDANQGQHNTCNITAVAKAEMMTKPGDQAQRFVDMVANETPADSTGMRYVNFPNGKGGTDKVYYDPNSLHPDREAQYETTHRGSGARDSYMQGLNHLYGNAETQKYGEFYTNERPTGQGDTGERLRIGGFDGPVRMTPPDENGKQKPASFGMLMEDVQDLMNKTGTGTAAADYDRFRLTGSSGISQVDAKDPKSLDAAWAANGGKPLVIGVDTNAAMFNTSDTVGGKSKGGAHVIMLADQRVNPDTGKTEYLLVNNWGDKFNGWVSGEAIASAMNPAKGDKSGSVPDAPKGGSNEGKNLQDQTLYRPPSANGDGNGNNAGPGGNNGGPERGPGIKTDNALQQELDWRKSMDDRMKDIQKQLQDEKDREALLKKLKQMAQEEEDERVRQQERKRRGGGSDQP